MKDAVSKSFSVRSFGASCLLLFIVALLLRTTGMNWGDVHPDENPSAAAKVLTGNLIPDVHYYPPFFNYVVAIAYAQLYGLGRLVGWWNSAEGFRAAYFSDKQTFVWVARLVTACISAATAPIAALLARELKLSRSRALLVGACVALFSATIYWARIAKGDNGIGPALLLFLLSAVRFHANPTQTGPAIFLGFTIALSLSFKHSAVFFLAPGLGILAMSTAYEMQLRSWLTSWLTAFLATVIFWVPMNVGIVLDPQGFIDAQIVQSQMSIRAFHPIVAVKEWYRAITSIEAGMPWPVLLLWFIVVPISMLVSQSSTLRFGLRLIFIASLIGIMTVALLAGQRQPTNLWLPYSTLIVTALLIGLFQFTLSSSKGIRLLAAFLISFTTLAFAVRDVVIIGEALAEPLQKQIALKLNQLPPNTRVLSNIELSSAMKISSVGEEEVRARNERLAAKYNVRLPKIAAESQQRRAEGHVVRPYPFVIGGLEQLSEKDFQVVLPFAWPIQLEEWQIDYWKRLNYTTFVVVDHGYFVHPVEAYRKFFRSLRDFCQEIALIKGPKPLFGQNDTYIYFCSD
jgi:hypothetical protein